MDLLNFWYFSEKMHLNDLGLLIVALPQLHMVIQLHLSQPDFSLVGISSDTASSLLTSTEPPCTGFCCTTLSL